MSFSAPPTPHRDALGEGNAWLHDLSGLAKFERQVLASPALTGVEGAADARSEISFESVE